MVCDGGGGEGGDNSVLIWQVTVIVDDLIPCTWNGRWWHPIFASPKDHAGSAIRYLAVILLREGWS